MEYIRTHWHGEHSLAWSFWVNGVLVTLVVLAGSSFLNETGLFQEVKRPTWLDVAIVVIWISPFIAITVWQLVGIWRSASRHKLLTGRVLWASVAHLAVIVGWLDLISDGVAYGKIIFQTAQVITGDLFDDHKIEVVDDTKINFEGEINYEAVDLIRGILSSGNEIGILQINSPGGIVLAGIELGRLVEEYGLIVLVTEQCYSSCTFTLVASPAPSIMPGAVIGFHRPHFAGVRGFETGLVGFADDFLAEHRVDQEVRRRMRTTPGSDMWVPTLQELAEREVIMHVFDSDAGQFVAIADWCIAKPSDCE